MKKRVAQWIGGGLLSAFSIMIYLMLFQTHLFSPLILNTLNRYVLSSKGISIQGDIQGGILSNALGLKKMRIQVTTSGEALIVAENISLLGWDWEWSTHELTLQQVCIDQYAVHSEQAVNLKRPGRASTFSLAAIIQDIRATDGEISYLSANSSQTISIPHLHSTLWYIDGFVDSKIHSSMAVIPSVMNDTLLIAGLLGIESNGEIQVRDLVVDTPTQHMNLDLGYASEKVSLSLRGNNFDPKSIKNLTLPQQFSDIQLDYDLDIQSAGDSLEMSGRGAARLNGHTIPFDLHNLEILPALQSLDISLGTEMENVRIIAHKTAAGDQSANIDLFRFDFNPILNDPVYKITEPIGKISVRGKQGDYVVDLILESFELNNIHFDTFESDFTYSSENGINIYTGLLTQDNNWLDMNGSFSDEGIDLKGYIGFYDFSFLDAIGVTNKLTGYISSRFNITGDMKNPRITGDVKPNDLSYDNKLTISGEGKVDFALSNDKIIGDVAIMGDHGFLLGDSLTSYTILANISENGYLIEDVHLQGLKNLLSISGGYDFNQITLNKLNIIKGENQVKLSDTLAIEKSPQGVFSVPSSVITFNNGGLSVEGEYSKKEGLALETAFEIIDVARMLDFLNLKSDFSGITSGGASISGPISDPIIDTRLTLNRGTALKYPSDSANVDIRITSNQVISNNIDAYTAGGHLNLVGRLPWGYKMRGTDINDTPQNFTINTENYRLRDLNFASIVGMPISGRATGVLSIRGTPVDTKMDIQLALEEATFDTLHFSKAYSEITYEGNLLTIDTLSMVSNWGYGFGNGFMPVSLDLIAPDRMAMAARDMGLDFEFNLNEMPFLSSYITTIDAIQGDFIGTLGLTGPLSAPIRNGKVRGHNARADISVLGNPITDIHAEVTLVDNTLNIDHFSGKMNFSEGSNLNTQGAVGWLASKAGDLIGVNAIQTYAGEVNASGTVDLSSFFKPRFDIDLMANEVYYRSTDGLIEAIADGNMKCTGQDTLNVEAVIPVLRAGYYANFESETSYDEIVSKIDSNVFKYSLNTQFASDLLISNDQMEAEFEGELWLLDYGDGIMRFSGSLTVLDGGKFYYLGNELDLVSGEIIFNSVDFNPQLSMEAEIDISGSRVGLTLTGDLSEPELVIDVSSVGNVASGENNQLTQSDVLTYLTLNKTMVEVKIDETALDPVKTYGEILMEKQISKLGREYIGLDLVGVDLASDSTRLRLGQRLSKNLMVTYDGAIQPTDGETDYDFGFEYQINKNVSVTSKINQDSEIELNARLKFTY